MRDICHALNEARHPATVWVRVWVSERATRCMCVPVSVLVCVCVCVCVLACSSAWKMPLTMAPKSRQRQFKFAHISICEMSKMRAKQKLQKGKSPSLPGAVRGDCCSCSHAVGSKTKRGT